MKQLLTIFSLLTFIGCDFKTSEDYHKEANKQEQEGNYYQAILLLDKAIVKDEKNINALLDRGVDKSMIKNFKSAIEDYTKVIELDSHNGLAYLNRGKNKSRLKDYTGAIEDFDKAISTKGNETIYMDKVENSFVKTGFEYDVKMEEIRFERGLAYYDMDSLRKAFDDFKFSIKKNYSLPDCYYWRGLIYLRYRMAKEGCEDLNKARESGIPEAQKLIDEYCKDK